MRHYTKKITYYLEHFMVLQDLVKKYSEFINFPIYLWATKEVDVEVPADEDESSESSEEEESCKFSVYVFISFR